MVSYYLMARPGLLNVSLPHSPQWLLANYKNLFLHKSGSTSVLHHHVSPVASHVLWFLYWFHNCCNKDVGINMDYPYCCLRHHFLFTYTFCYISCSAQKRLKHLCWVKNYNFFRPLAGFSSLTAFWGWLELNERRRTIGAAVVLLH